MNNINAILNTFINDLFVFLKKYYSTAYSKIEISENEGNKSLIINSFNKNYIRVSAESYEINIYTFDNHFHIDNFDEPFNVNLIFRNVIDILVGIMNNRIIFYSAWKNNICIGGGSLFLDTCSKIEFSSDSDYFRIFEWNNKDTFYTTKNKDLSK